MATTREQLEELRKEVRRLKNENTKTRRILREHGLWPVEPKKSTQLSKREQARLDEVIRATYGKYADGPSLTQALLAERAADRQREDAKTTRHA